MLESKTVTINGTQFRIQQLGALQARSVARLLLNEVGRGLRAVGQSSVGLDDLAEKAIAAGVGELLADLSEDTLERLTAAFLGSTSVRTAGASDFQKMDDDLQNALFCGGKGLATWMRWLVECVEFSTWDFFLELGRLRGRFAPKADDAEAADTPPSPSTSTGSSTGSRPPIAIGRR